MKLSRNTHLTENRLDYRLGMVKYWHAAERWLRLGNGLVKFKDDGGGTAGFCNTVLIKLLSSHNMECETIMFKQGNRNRGNYLWAVNKKSTFLFFYILVSWWGQLKHSASLWAFTPLILLIQGYWHLVYIEKSQHPKWDLQMRHHWNLNPGSPVYKTSALAN